MLTEYECHHEETYTRFYFLFSDILHIGMENQLKLSKSVNICFAKTPNSKFNYCSVNLLVEEIDHNEQLPVVQII